MTGSVLVDATNLRVGGGVQVAASLIEWLLIFLDRGELGPSWGDRVEVECSIEVARNLGERAHHPAVRVVTLERASRSNREAYDVHWVVFGPLWGPRRGRKLVLGYADVTAVYPGFSRGPKARMRAWLSRASLQRPDVVVVETDEFRDQLIRRGVRSGGIAVISNTLHQVFEHVEPVRTAPVTIRPSATLVMGYVTRPYPHKNLAILPEIRSELDRLGNIDLRFAVTLTNDEWRTSTPELRESCNNHGQLKVAELPDFYRKLDGVVFPSKLEAFSAAPLEAMRMGLPLFASDRGFVRSVCKDAPFYADPENPTEWASVILDAFSDVEQLERHRRAGERVVTELPSGAERARQYVGLVSTLL